MSIPGPPKELEWMTYVLVGEKWPQGDEDAMRELGEAWRQLGKDLAPLEDQLKAVIAKLDQAGQGPAVEAARAFLKQIAGSADGILPKLLASIEEVAKAAKKVALEIEYAKLMIIGFAAMLAYMLLKLLYLSIVTFGAATPAAAAVTETFRQMAMRLLKRLMLSMLQGALFMVALDAAVQGFQVVVLKTRDIKEWDLKKTGFMAGIGALGGAIGWALGWMRRLPFGKTLPVTIIKNALAEGLPELIADEIQKNDDTNHGKRDDFVGGLLSGGVEGLIEHPTKILGRRPIFTDSNLQRLLGKMFGANIMLGPPPDILVISDRPPTPSKDLPDPPAGSPSLEGDGSTTGEKDSHLGNGTSTGNPSVDVKILTTDDAAGGNQVPPPASSGTNATTSPNPGARAAVPPAAGGSNLGGPATGTSSNNGTGTSSNNGTGVSDNNGTGDDGSWLPDDMSDVGVVDNLSVDGLDLDDPNSVVVDQFEFELQRDEELSDVNAELRGVLLDGPDAVTVSDWLTSEQLVELIGAELGQEKVAELLAKGVTEERMAELAREVLRPDRLAASLINELLGQVRQDYTNIFGPMLPATDPITGTPLARTSPDQVQKMEAAWQERRELLRQAGTRGPNALVGVLFVEATTAGEVDPIIEQWLAAHPDVAVPPVDRIALRDALVRQVGRDVLTQLGDGSAGPNQVRSAVAARMQGAQLEQEVVARLDEFAAQVTVSDSISVAAEVNIEELAPLAAATATRPAASVDESDVAELPQVQVQVPVPAVSSAGQQSPLVPAPTPTPTAVVTDTATGTDTDSITSAEAAVSSAGSHQSPEEEGSGAANLTPAPVASGAIPLVPRAGRDYGVKALSYATQTFVLTKDDGTEETTSPATDDAAAKAGTMRQLHQTSVWFAAEELTPALVEDAMTSALERFVTPNLRCVVLAIDGAGTKYAEQLQRMSEKYPKIRFVTPDSGRVRVTDGAVEAVDGGWQWFGNGRSRGVSELPPSLHPTEFAAWLAQDLSEEDESSEPADTRKTSLKKLFTKKLFANKTSVGKTSVGKTSTNDMSTQTSDVDSVVAASRDRNESDTAAGSSASTSAASVSGQQLAQETEKPTNDQSPPTGQTGTTTTSIGDSAPSTDWRDKNLPPLPSVEVESATADRSAVRQVAGSEHEQVLWLGDPNAPEAAAERAAAAVAPSAANLLTVVSHLDQRRERIQVGNRFLTAAEFAAYLREEHGWPERGGRDILLVACEADRAGEDGAPSFAQQLRGTLGVGVLATPKTVYSLADGRVLAGNPLTVLALGAGQGMGGNGVPAAGWVWYPADLTQPGKPLGAWLTPALQKLRDGVVVPMLSSPLLASVRWAGSQQSTIGAAPPVSDLTPLDNGPESTNEVSAEPVELRDVEWAIDMLAVLEDRLRLAERLYSVDDPAVQEAAARLAELRAAVAEAAADPGNLLSFRTPDRALATDQEMLAWQRDAGQRWKEELTLAENATDAARRVPHLRNSVMYRDFPLWTGSRGRGRGALESDDFLPLVQNVLGNGITEVTANHLAELDGHIQTLIEDGQPVTRAALVRREQFRLLAEALHGDATQLATQVDTLLNTADFTDVPADRKLEIREVVRRFGSDLRIDLNPTTDSLTALDKVIEAAHRHYRKSHPGVQLEGPLRLEHVRDLIRHKLGAHAAHDWASVERIANRLPFRADRNARRGYQQWAHRPLRTFTAKVGLGRTGVYRSVAAWQASRAEKQPGQPDSPPARRAERDALWQTVLDSPLVTARSDTSVTLSLPGPAVSVSSDDSASVASVAEPSAATEVTVTREDLTELVYARRKLYADPRDRGYQGFASYGSMALELLGTGSTVGATELAQLAVLAREARARVDDQLRYDRAAHRQAIVAAAISRWHADKAGRRPTPPGITEDHSRMVSAFHAIGELPFAPELTTWLNGIVPLADGAITEATVRRKLVSLFAQALDDGADFPVTVGGRTYYVRLWPVAVAEPEVEAGSLPGAAQSTRFSGKQENRIYRYRDLAASRTESQGTNWDAGIAYRTEFGTSGEASAGRVDLAATYGQAHTKGRRQLNAVAVADFQQLRIKEKLGNVHLRVNWVARVQDGATGRWQEFFFQDTGGRLREDTVPYAVAEFQLPYSVEQAQLSQGTDPDHRQGRLISNPEEFPVWRLDHAVSRVQLADRVLAEMRAALSTEDYAFWQPVLESYLTNDQLAMGLGDILRPRGEQDFQQVFRHTLQRDGRYLTFSLTAGDLAQPVNRVEKISEVSRSGETRFDWVRTLVNKSLLSRDTTDTQRGTFTGALRVLNKMVQFGGRAQVGGRTGLQLIRNLRSMLTRALRVGGTVQNVLADFTVRLDLEHRRDGGASVEKSVSIDGYAQFMLHSSDLRKLPLDWSEARLSAHQEADRAEDAKLTVEETPDGTKKWWTPGSGFGLTMDFVLRLDGVAELYNGIVPVLVRAGYLPAEAAGGTVTPWAYLQAMPLPGGAFNQPGQAYANWRNLLDQLSESSLRTRADDLLGADDSQPGVTLTFVHPESQNDLSRQVTVGLWAETATDSEHQGITKYQIQYGHTSIDTLAAKGVHGSTQDYSGYGGLDLYPVGAPMRAQYGRQYTTSATDKVGRNQSTSLTSDTDGQKMPASRYQVPIRWHWIIEQGRDPIGNGVSDGQVTLIQPDELHARAGEPPVPNLNAVTTAASVLESMTTAIYTTIGAEGVGRLQNKLIQALPNVPKAAIWQGLTPTVYKSSLLRSLGSAATIPIGDQEVVLTSRPVGRPQIVKVWLPYTQQVLESQVGREQGTDSVTQKGWQGQLAGRSDHVTGDGTVTRSTGTGQGSAQLSTVGSYRAVYQDTEMAIVRTEVVNEIIASDGTRVVERTEVLLNVLLVDVLANRDGFDNTERIDELLNDARARRDNAEKPGLLDKYLDKMPTPQPPPLARALTAQLDPPVSLQGGNSWAVVWPMLFNGGRIDVGLGQLTDQLTSAAREMGGPELAVQVASIPSWLSPLMGKMTDGGASWTFTIQGGRVFELVLTAELTDRARGDQPGPTGEKVYQRGNEYRDDSRRNNAATGVTGSLLGVGGPVAVTGALSHTGRLEQADARGSNLLFMEGLRANKLTDFVQRVTYVATLREITDLVTRVGDRLRSAVGRPAPARTWTTSVTAEHKVSVPTEGTLPRGTPRQDLRFTLPNRLPSTYRIQGIRGLRAIFDVARRSAATRVLDPATVAATARQLNFENLPTNLAAMLSDEGARFDEVAIASQVLGTNSGGLHVRARFGRPRQIYYMAKAELENYDHGTDLATHSSNNTGSTALSGSLTVAIPVAPGQYVGPRIGAGRAWNTATGADRTAWAEHRAWLRQDNSVYFVTVDLDFDVTVAGRTVQVGGQTEIVVTLHDALELGVPRTALKSVTPSKEWAKAFPDDPTTSASDSGGGSFPTVSNTLLQQIVRTFGATYQSLQTVDRTVTTTSAGVTVLSSDLLNKELPPLPSGQAGTLSAAEAADMFQAAFSGLNGPTSSTAVAGSSGDVNSTALELTTLPSVEAGQPIEGRSAVRQAAESEHGHMLWLGDLNSSAAAAEQAAAAVAPRAENLLTVVSHLDEQRERIQLGDRFLTAAEFAAYLREEHGWPERGGPDILLVACEADRADARGESFAQQLRNTLGVGVLTTQGLVYTLADGQVVAVNPETVLASGSGQGVGADQAPTVSWVWYPADPDQPAELLLGASLVSALRRLPGRAEVVVPVHSGAPLTPVRWAGPPSQSTSGPVVVAGMSEGDRDALRRFVQEQPHTLGLTPGNVQQPGPEQDLWQQVVLPATAAFGKLPPMPGGSSYAYLPQRPGLTSRRSLLFWLNNALLGLVPAGAKQSPPPVGTVEVEIDNGFLRDASGLGPGQTNGPSALGNFATPDGLWMLDGSDGDASPEYTVIPVDSGPWDVSFEQDQAKIAYGDDPLPDEIHAAWTQFPAYPVYIGRGSGNDWYDAGEIAAILRYNRASWHGKRLFVVVDPMSPRNNPVAGLIADALQYSFVAPTSWLVVTGGKAAAGEIAVYVANDQKLTFGLKALEHKGWATVHPNQGFDWSTEYGPLPDPSITPPVQPGQLVHQIPTLGDPSTGPTAQPSGQLGGEAARLFAQSTATPSGRHFFGNPLHSMDDLQHMQMVIGFPGFPGLYELRIHGEEGTVRVGSESFDPAALAEAVAADPYWRADSSGRRPEILLNICNVYAQRADAVPFLPIAQLFADRLSQLLNTKVTAWAAGGIVTVNRYGVAEVDVLTHVAGFGWSYDEQHSAARFYQVTGRLPGESLAVPQPGPTHYPVTRSRPYLSSGQAGSRAPSVPFDLPFPVPPGTELTGTDELATRLAGPAGQFADLLARARAVAPDLALSDVLLVALSWYLTEYHRIGALTEITGPLSELAAYEASLRRGMVRAAEAAVGQLPARTGGSWGYVAVPVPPGEDAYLCVRNWLRDPGPGPVLTRDQLQPTSGEVLVAVDSRLIKDVSALTHGSHDGPVGLASLRGKSLTVRTVAGVHGDRFEVVSEAWEKANSPNGHLLWFATQWPAVNQAAAPLLPRAPYALTVVSQFDPSGSRIKVEDNFLTAEEFADYLRSWHGWPDAQEPGAARPDVVLVADEAGLPRRSTDSFAQRVATALGVGVFAPLAPVTIQADGTVLAGSVPAPAVTANVNGKLAPSGWIWFPPGRPEETKQTPEVDLVTALAILPSRGASRPVAAAPPAAVTAGQIGPAVTLAAIASTGTPRVELNAERQRRHGQATQLSASAVPVETSDSEAGTASQVGPGRDTVRQAQSSSGHVLWLGVGGQASEAAERAAAAVAPRAANMLTVVSHFDVAGQRIQVGQRFLTAAEFADQLRTEHGWPSSGGPDVALVVCAADRSPQSSVDSFRTPDSFAQQLRDQLGVGVLASRATVFTRSDGEVIGGGVGVHRDAAGRLRLGVAAESGWRWYSPTPGTEPQLLSASLTTALRRIRGADAVVVPANGASVTPVEWVNSPDPFGRDLAAARAATQHTGLSDRALVDIWRFVREQPQLRQLTRDSIAPSGAARDLWTSLVSPMRRLLPQLPAMPAGVSYVYLPERANQTREQSVLYWLNNTATGPVLAGGRRAAPPPGTIEVEVDNAFLRSVAGLGQSQVAEPAALGELARPRAMWTLEAAHNTFPRRYRVVRTSQGWAGDFRQTGASLYRVPDEPWLAEISRAWAAAPMPGVYPILIGRDVLVPRRWLADAEALAAQLRIHRDLWEPQGMVPLLVADSLTVGSNDFAQRVADLLQMEVVGATRQLLVVNGQIVAGDVGVYESPGGPTFGVRTRPDRGWAWFQPGRGFDRNRWFGPRLTAGKQTPAPRPGRLIHRMPTWDNPSALPVAQIPPGLDAAAAKLFSESVALPGGRIFLGNPVVDANLGLAWAQRAFIGIPGMYEIALHGGTLGVTISSDVVDAKVLAEVVAADPYWQPDQHGNRPTILLSICNVYAQKNGALPFLPVHQEFADALSMIIGSSAEVIGAGGIVLLSNDGVLSAMVVIPGANGPVLSARHSAAQFYRIFGRLTGDPLREPVPAGSRFPAHRSTSNSDYQPTQAPPIKVPISLAFPVGSWQARDPDLMATRLVGVGGQFQADLVEGRQADPTHAQWPPEQLVALRRYLKDYHQIGDLTGFGKRNLDSAATYLAGNWRGLVRTAVWALNFRPPLLRSAGSHWGYVAVKATPGGDRHAQVLHWLKRPGPGPVLTRDQVTPGPDEVLVAISGELVRNVTALAAGIVPGVVGLVNLLGADVHLRPETDRGDGVGPRFEVVHPTQVRQAQSASGGVLWLGGRNSSAPAERAAVAVAPRIPFTLTVLSHFDTASQRIQVGQEFLTAGEFADHLRTQYGWPASGGPDLLLVVCDSGARNGTATSFAAQLRTELGVGVLAPRAKAFTQADGAVVSGGVALRQNATGQMTLLPTPSTDTGWVWYPRGGAPEVETADTHLQDALRSLRLRGFAPTPAVSQQLTPVEWSGRPVKRQRTSLLSGRGSAAPARASTSTTRTPGGAAIGSMGGGQGTPPADTGFAADLDAATGGVQHLNLADAELVDVWRFVRDQALRFPPTSSSQADRARWEQAARTALSAVNHLDPMLPGTSYAYLPKLPGRSDEQSIQYWLNTSGAGPVLAGARQPDVPPQVIEVEISNGLLRDASGFAQARVTEPATLGNLAEPTLRWVLSVDDSRSPRHRVEPVTPMWTATFAADKAYLVGVPDDPVALGFIAAIDVSRVDSRYFPVFIADHTNTAAMFGLAEEFAAELRANRGLWAGRTPLLIVDPKAERSNRVAELIADMLQVAVVAPTERVLVLNGEIVAGRLGVYRTGNGSLTFGANTQVGRGWTLIRPNSGPDWSRQFGPRMHQTSANMVQNPVPLPGQLVQRLPTDDDPSAAPLAQPPAGLSAAAARLFQNSVALPGRRAFSGNPVVARDIGEAMSWTQIPERPDLYEVVLHGGARELAVGGERFDVTVLAEVVAADLNWIRGGRKEILLNFCNVYAQRAEAVPFLPLAQRFADVLSQRLGGRTTVLAAGGNVYISAYGVLGVRVAVPDQAGGTVETSAHSAARFYRVFGRLPNDPLHEPVPMSPQLPPGRRWVQGGTDVDQSAAPLPVPLDIGFPVPSGWDPQFGDLLAVQIVGPAGQYDTDVAQVRSAAPASLAAVLLDEQIAAVRGYLREYDRIGTLTSITAPETGFAAYQSALWRGLVRTVVFTLDDWPPSARFAPEDRGYVRLPVPPGQDRHQTVLNWLNDPGPGPVRTGDATRPGPDEVLVAIHGALIRDVTALSPDPSAGRVGLANLRGADWHLRPMRDQNDGLGPRFELVHGVRGAQSPSGQVLWLPGPMATPAERTAAALAPRAANMLTVVAHFDATSGRIAVDGQLLTAPQFAEHLRNMHGWPVTGGPDLLLVAGGSGVSPRRVQGTRDSFARQLRDLLGVGVLAPQAPVFTRNDGTVLAGGVSLVADARGRLVLRLDLSGPTGWKWYRASGGSTETSLSSVDLALAALRGGQFVPPARRGGAPLTPVRWAGPPPQRQRTGDVSSARP